MTNLSRRTVLAGAAAVAAATQAGRIEVSYAAAPPANTQNTSWYRYKVGDIEVTAATDGAGRFKTPDNFVLNKSKDEVNAAWTAMFMKADEMVIPYTPLAINTGGKLVIIDTGNGEAGFERSKGAQGQFHSNLKAAGIDRNAVDVVIISHFHTDHINGLLNPENKLAFPNAEVLVPAVEWKYFMDDAEMGRQTTERMKGVFANVRRVFDALGRKVTPYEDKKEVAPGITSVFTPGHTPGHMSFVVASGNDTVFVQSDVTNNVLFVRNPGWHLMFDQDPVTAEATRRKVYDMLAVDKLRVQGFHHPFPALSHVEKTSTGYREVPVVWNPVL